MYSVHDENRLNKNEPLLFRKLWIRIQKPVFPAWKLLCKNYNHKGTSKKNIKNDIIKADYDKNKFIYSTTFIGQKYGMVFKNGCYGQGYYPDKRDR